MASQEKENLINSLDLSTSTMESSSSSSSMKSEMGESLWHSGSMKNKRSQDIKWEMGEAPPIGAYEVLENLCHFMLLTFHFCHFSSIDYFCFR